MSLINKQILGIAPSGKINQAKLLSGLTNLQIFFKPSIIVGKNIGQLKRNMAGTDENRLADFVYGLTSDTIHIVWAIRGGFGASRVLPLIAKDLIINPKKLLIGYSDITFYQWFLYKYYHLKSISGMMLQVDFETIYEKDLEINHLLSLINNKHTHIDLPVSVKSYHFEKIEAPIIGGCLAIISKMMGTEYMPDLSKHILFLEDINEDIAHIDAYFSHLQNCQIFNSVAAVILGQFTPPENTDMTIFRKEYTELVDEYFISKKIPVMINFPIGHIPKIISLPIGYRCILTPKFMDFFND